MTVPLALMSALAFGASDFFAGVASRRVAAGQVAIVGQALALVTVGLAVLPFAGAGFQPRALEWGALSGLGNAIGTVSLYRGPAVAQMTVVSTLSAVLAAVVPVLVGIALGNHLTATAAIGITTALLARTVLSERWTSNQVAGLLTAALAIVLVTIP